MERDQCLSTRLMEVDSPACAPRRRANLLPPTAGNVVLTLADQATTRCFDGY
jgi:hypothetical protein